MSLSLRGSKRGHASLPNLDGGLLQGDGHSSLPKLDENDFDASVHVPPTTRSSTRSGVMDASIHVEDVSQHDIHDGKNGWDEELGSPPIAQSTATNCPYPPTQNDNNIPAPGIPLRTTDFEKFELEIQALEMRLNRWREVSGMHTMKIQLEEMNKSENLDVNDVTLSAINGINHSSRANFDGVLETAVVAALLMTFSVPMACNPPDFIQWKDDGLSHATEWQRLIHLYGWAIMSILGMMIIMYARIYTSAIARAARDSDRLRIQMTGNAFNEILFMLFAMTHFFGWGIFADTSAVYGVLHGAVLTILAYGGVILAIHWAAKYVRAGHIEYGWRANRKMNESEDPIDDFIAFQLLQKKMEYAQSMRSLGEAKSVFEWDKQLASKKCWGPLMFEWHPKGPTGLSADGRKLFGLSDKNQ